MWFSSTWTKWSLHQLLRVTTTATTLRRYVCHGKDSNATFSPFINIFWKIQITQVWWPISTVVRFTRWSWRDHSIGLDSFLSRQILHPKSGLVLLNIFSNGPDGPPWTIASGLMILLRWISWKRLLQDMTTYICAHYAPMNIAHLLFLSSSWKSNHLLNGDGVNQLTNQYNHGLLPTRYSGWDDCLESLWRRTCHGTFCKKCDQIL